MKKIMTFILMSTLCLTNCFAQCSDEPEGNCGEVYKFRLTLKTTAGKLANIRTYSECEETQNIAYRIQSTKIYYGVIYNCGCDSFCQCEDMFPNNIGSVVLWDPRTRAVFTDADLQFDILNRFNYKGNKIEAAGEFNFGDSNFKFGGHGNYFILKNKNSLKEIRLVKNLNGYVVGTLSCPYAKASKCADLEPAGYFDICSDELVVDDSMPTVAFGQFSLIYDKYLSQSFSKNGSVKDLRLPTYVYEEILETE